MSRVRDSVARHPIVAFLLIGNGVYLAAALSPPLVGAKVLPFGLPLFAVVGTIFGVGLAAFAVTGASDGWSGVRDLARRSLRWRSEIAGKARRQALFEHQIAEAPNPPW